MTWGAAQTILELANVGVLLAAFAVDELRRRNPMVPFSILRVTGLVAADAAHLLAFAAAFSMLFFVTLYMQEVLR